MESNKKPGFAPAGAPMNNMPFPPAMQGGKKSSNTGAKVAAGAAAGAAAAFGASAAYHHLEGETDDALLDNTAEPLAAEPEEVDVITAELESEDTEVVDPNEVMLEPEEEEPPMEIDDFVLDDDVPVEEFGMDEPIALEDVDTDMLPEEDAEDLLSFDDEGDLNCDPIDDMII